MKHTDWLRLQTEGENVCAILRQQDYQCLKQTRRLSWKVSKEGTSCWAYVLFVHRRDKGGQFISYRKLAMWLKAIASIIQTSTTLDDLWQVGLWIKQECEKFDYDKPVLEYLRRVWAKHRDYLRDLQQGADATTQAVASALLHRSAIALSSSH